jgi:hypothetical protein
MTKDEGRRMKDEEIQKTAGMIHPSAFTLHP